MYKCHTGHQTVDQAFRIALGDLHSNILPYHSGVLTSARPMFMAGLDYDSPWTRDSSINAWNGGSLLYPEVAKNTLLGVLEETGGRLEIGGQYWDKIIWAAGAWNHYLVTGDVDFLVLAFTAIRNTLETLELEEFDSQVGLFRGAACFQDGVSGYPDRYARTNGSSDIRDWVRANPTRRSKVGFGLPLFACSTNCLYLAAYEVATEMAIFLKQPGSARWKRRASALKKRIVECFWMAREGRIAYLFDKEERCEHEEGLGSAFAILFGVVDRKCASRILEMQHVTPHGVPCVWPTFDRYRTPDGFGVGRHSGTIWPQVQGFWAEAAARNGRDDLLMLEMMSLAAKAVRDVQFTEIYHPVTGEIHGGRQESAQNGCIITWESCRRQTWSATAYLRMILHGVCGMRLEPEGLHFRPTLGAPLTELKLTGLSYRGLTFDLHLTGTGSAVKRLLKNGRSQRDLLLKADEKGHAEFLVELEHSSRNS